MLCEDGLMNVKKPLGNQSKSRQSDVDEHTVTAAKPIVRQTPEVTIKNTENTENTENNELLENQTRITENETPDLTPLADNALSRLPRLY